MANDKTTVSIRRQTHGNLRVGAAVRGMDIIDALDEAVSLWIGDVDKLADRAAKKLGAQPRRTTTKSAAA